MGQAYMVMGRGGVGNQFLADGVMLSFRFDGKLLKMEERIPFGDSLQEVEVVSVLTQTGQPLEIAYNIGSEFIVRQASANVLSVIDTLFKIEGFMFNGFIEIDKGVVQYLHFFRKGTITTQGL